MFEKIEASLPTKQDMLRIFLGSIGFSLMLFVVLVGIRASAGYFHWLLPIAALCLAAGFVDFWRDAKFNDDDESWIKVKEQLAPITFGTGVMWIVTMIFTSTTWVYIVELIITAFCILEIGFPSPREFFTELFTRLYKAFRAALYFAPFLGIYLLTEKWSWWIIIPVSIYIEYWDIKDKTPNTYSFKRGYTALITAGLVFWISTTWPDLLEPFRWAGIWVRWSAFGYIMLGVLTIDTARNWHTTQKHEFFPAESPLTWFFEATMVPAWRNPQHSRWLTETSVFISIATFALAMSTEMALWIQLVAPFVMFFSAANILRGYLNIADAYAKSHE